MARAAAKTDYFLPKEYFLSMCGITPTDFDAALGEDPRLSANNEGYPVFGMCRYWYMKSKQVNVMKHKGMTAEEIELKTKKQNLLRLTLGNMKLLALFIPKSIAESRIKKLLLAIATTIKYCITESTSSLAKTFDIDDRMVAEKLTTIYNKAILKLYSGANHVTWADETDAKLIKSKFLEGETDQNMLSMVEDFEDIRDSALEDPLDGMGVDDAISEEI